MVSIAYSCMIQLRNSAEWRIGSRKLVLLSVLVLVPIAVLMAGCAQSAPTPSPVQPTRIPNPVQQDLLEYLNAELREIANLEEEALERYGSVTGDNHTDDETLIVTLADEVVPKYMQFIDKLEAIMPETEQVAIIHEICVEAANTQMSGFLTVLAAIDRQDSALAVDAAEKLSRERRLVRDFLRAASSLANERDVLLLPTSTVAPTRTRPLAPTMTDTSISTATPARTAAPTPRPTAALTPTSTPRSTKVEGYIAVGSVKDDVVRIMGEPNSVAVWSDEARWYYSDAMVFLDPTSNRVTSWQYDGPLGDSPFRPFWGTPNSVAEGVRAAGGLERPPTHVSTGSHIDDVTYSGRAQQHGGLESRSLVVL